MNYGGDVNRDQVVSGTRHDRGQWDRFFENTIGLQGAVNRYKSEVPHAENLAEDYFRALYSPTVEIRRGEPDLALSEAIISAAVKLPEYQSKLRPETVNNPLASIFATGAMVESTLPQLLQNKRLADAARETRRAQAMQRMADRQVQNRSQLAERYQRLADQDGEGSGFEQLRDDAVAEAEHAEAEAEKAKQDAESAAGEMGAALEAMGPELRNILRAGITAGVGAAEEAGEIADLLGVPGEMHGTGGSSSDVDPAELVKLIESAKRMAVMKNLVRMLGRIDALAANARESKRDSDAGTLHDYKRSRDVQKMAGMSRAYYALPQLRNTIWLAQLADAQLTTHNARGQNKSGKGPVIVALDRSGSMSIYRNGPLLGPSMRSELATAIAIGVVRDAAMGGRDVAVVQFADRTKVDVFPKGVHTPQQIVAMMTGYHDLGGGTDYGAWTASAESLLRQAEFKKADVLVVTDVSHPNECAMAPQAMQKWAAVRKELECRVFTVVVGKGKETFDRNMLTALTDSALFLDDAENEKDALNQLLSRV